MPLDVRLILALMLLTACADPPRTERKADAAVPNAVRASASEEIETIGSAEMGAQGTITLMLSVREPNIVGDGVLVYRKDDPDYDYILKHVGPLKPGQSVAVRAFPK